MRRFLMYRKVQALYVIVIVSSILTVSHGAFAVQNVTFQPSTIIYGDSITLSFNFEPGSLVADCRIYWDMNQSGTVDSSDLLLLREKFWDNDGWDENPTNFKYSRIFDYRELHHVPTQYVAKVQDSGSPGTATFTINPVTSSTSISGTVTQPANTQNLIAFYFILEPGSDPENYFASVIDNFGDFTIHIPDDFAGYPGGFFVCDQADVVPEWTKSAMEFMTVVGHVTNHDVEMMQATAWVYGQVEDETGSPLPDGYEIFAETDGPSETGHYQNGWYRIGLVDDEWKIEGDITQLHYDYLFGQEVVNISSGDSIRTDLVFYSANSTISGTIYLDGLPYSRITVVAECSQGYSSGRSDNHGEYQIHLSNQISNYQLEIDNNDVPAGYFVQEEYIGIAPGATNIDFHMIPIAGGVSGTISVEIGDPIPDFTEFMVWGEETGGGDTYSVEVLMNGTYELRLPQGMFNVRLGQPWSPPFSNGSYCWMPPDHDSIVVNQTIEPGFDFELNYAQARVRGDLIGLPQPQELMMSGWEGTTVGEYFVATMVGGDFNYELRVCEGIWHLIPPEVEGYDMEPQGYTFVVNDDDTLFSGYNFNYTSVWVSPEPSAPIESEFQLGACFPNPFNSSIVVTYRIPEPGLVTMSACNVLGRRVALIFRQTVSAGVHEIKWIPEDMASGIYFLELTWRDQIQIAKVMYLR